MHKFVLIILLSTVWTLSSCWKTPDVGVTQEDIAKALNTGKISEKIRKIINNNCLTGNFSQGQDDNLYGRKCLEGRHLLIQTGEKDSSPAIATSASVSLDKNQVDGLKLEGKLDFIGRVYNPTYRILTNKGSDKHIPFLKKFLPLNKEFLGSSDKQYKIVFKMEGNYLVLYKASKNLDDIPYIERTSLERSKDGQYKKSKEGYYMVPFLGYQIEYCKAETQVNEKTGAKTFKDTTVCQPHYANNKDAEYIKISKIGEGEKYDIKERRIYFLQITLKGNGFFLNQLLRPLKLLLTQILQVISLLFHLIL